MLLLDAVLLTGLRVLDLGYGTGTLTIYIARFVGPNGSTPDREPLENRVFLGNENIATKNEKRKRGGGAELVISLPVGRVENVMGMIATGPFDLIFMNSIFHWVQDQEIAIEHYSPQSQKNWVLSRERYRVYAATGIARHLTQDTLQSLLQKSEFLSKTIDLVPHKISFPDYGRLIAFEIAKIFGNFLDFRFLPGGLSQAGCDQGLPSSRQERENSDDRHFADDNLKGVLKASLLWQDLFTSFSLDI
ncbi:hypothetical protein BofuT4_P108000.1 [Botrytis cinerea T4]|uniref:Uncharacterized protein n=1 Tax=Botryotinia fuckeliana (strain T4) TaxID=999810 RepID=G2Y714_BOTF4|nr:hypothetical protein BofuT4_P108000.1 [Botrytis cinerea T4]